MYVSISAYNDARLLDGCLRSVRDVLGNVAIDVVDGAYESWPGDDDNSTDDTAAVAAEWDAAYRPAGPFEREVNKHRYRVAIAPEHTRALFLDADERLVRADQGSLRPDTAYAVRIHNPVVYSESPISYWPRCFDPATVAEVSRWDKYLFETPCKRTDAVTIAHRHDLRDRTYREDKYQRFDNEGRAGRYEESFEQYLNNDWDIRTTECPECGHDSLVRSPATNDMPDESFSRLSVCVRDDGCYTAVESVAVDDWKYLPGDWERGLTEDPERLRVELLDAGCEWVGMQDFTTLRSADQLSDLKPSIRLFVKDTFERSDDEARVFS